MRTIIGALSIFTAFFILSGFNINNAIIPKQEILSGGPSKDGIPAILEPKLIRPNEALFLKDSDAVIGVVVGGKARAYPINILNWHEVVNDTINGVPVVVTF